MKYILTILMIFILGCSGKINYLLVKPPTICKVKIKNLSLGVRDIGLPFYLQDGKLPYAKANKIEFFDSYFAKDAEEFIKKRAINILQNYYKDAFDYPWENKRADLIVQINIKRFITINKTLTLNASYDILNKNKKVIKRKNFHKSLRLAKVNENTVLEGMEELFDEFINSISQN